VGGATTLTRPRCRVPTLAAAVAATGAWWVGVIPRASEVKRPAASAAPVVVAVEAVVVAASVAVAAVAAAVAEAAVAVLAAAAAVMIAAAVAAVVVAAATAVVVAAAAAAAAAAEPINPTAPQSRPGPSRGPPAAVLVLFGLGRRRSCGRRWRRRRRGSWRCKLLSCS